MFDLNRNKILADLRHYEYFRTKSMFHKFNRRRQESILKDLNSIKLFSDYSDLCKGTTHLVLEEVLIFIVKATTNKT